MHERSGQRSSPQPRVSAHNGVFITQLWKASADTGLNVDRHGRRRDTESHILCTSFTNYLESASPQKWKDQWLPGAGGRVGSDYFPE